MSDANIDTREITDDMRDRLSHAYRLIITHEPIMAADQLRVLRDEADTLADHLIEEATNA